MNDLLSMKSNMDKNKLEKNGNKLQLKLIEKETKSLKWLEETHIDVTIYTPDEYLISSVVKRDSELLESIFVSFHRVFHPNIMDLKRRISARFLQNLQKYYT